jgi:hypothetical protein
MDENDGGTGKDLQVIARLSLGSDLPQFTQHFGCIWFLAVALLALHHNF